VSRPALLLSLDYEPWFSVNTPDEAAVIIPPTDAILATCERHGARATLFVDVLALRRLEEVGRGAIAARIAAQVADAVARDHDAQLHLHPHWLAATWDGGWRFPADAYRLDAPDMDDDAVAARTEALARDGIARLRAAIGDPAYPVVAFRAGGYAIQPRDGAVLRGLLAAGLRIDSSVVPGMRKRTGRQAVDFTAAPALPTWRVAPETGVLAPAPRGLLEIPIAAADLGPGAGMAQARFFRRPPGALIGGAGHSRDAAEDSAASGSRVDRLRRRLDYGIRGFTPLILPLPAPLLLAAAEAWIARHAGKGVIAFSAMAHPKGFTRESLAALDAFIGGLAGRVRFATFARIEAETFPADSAACYAQG
jgi:peptidoglycan/xylan/chitin deacetylase (PgdA/CDA1 family)